jgi:hypothetical protein
MNLELAGVADKLVQDYPELPVMEIIGVLCECADQCDCAGPFFIEQAARACLSARQRRLLGADEAAAPAVAIPEQPVPRHEADDAPRPVPRPESAAGTTRAAAAPA